MNKILEGITCLLFALILAAPSLSAQESSAAARTQPSVASAPAPSTPPPSPALTSALNDLDRVTSTTEADIKNMGSGEESDRNWWKFWHTAGSSRSSEDEKAAASQQRNLHDAMPRLIQNARTSGSFAATFRLYHNLSVVCELLDTLVKSRRSQDDESDTALANDAAAMGRVRQGLATYIEQTAVAMDTRNQYAPTTSTPTTTASTSATTASTPTTTASTPTTKPPTKIVVDDTIPVKKIVVDDTVPVKKVVVDDTGPVKKIVADDIIVDDDVPVKRSAKKTGATAPQ